MSAEFPFHWISHYQSQEVALPRMSGGYGLLLTGRPASRSTNRAYESHHHSLNSARPEQAKWDSEV